MSEVSVTPVGGGATSWVASPKTTTPQVPSNVHASLRPRRGVMLGAGVLVILALLAGAVATLGAPGVQTGQVHRGLAVDVVYASGVVEYVRQAHIAPIVTAPIRGVMVEEGQAVRQGQTLAQLEDGPQQGVVLQLRAQAAQARAIAARTTRLRQAGFAAPAADEDAQAQREAAEAAAAGAAARLEDYRVKAPITGKILRRDAEPGDLASTGSVLFLLADPARLRVTADVDERDVARLAVGQSALIRADGFPGRTFSGQVDQITPAGDATGRVFRVRVGLPSDALLRPGMTVELNLVTGRRENVLLAPSSAIRDGAVWTLVDGKAHRAPVMVGAASGNQVEIVSGLPSDAWIILAPPKSLREGARVRTARP